MRPGDRARWLALGLLLGVLALAYATLVHPWWTVPMREAGDRIDTLQQRELDLRMQLQQAPQVEQRLQQARAQQHGRSGFLPESNPELATAGLIQRLETVVAQASPGNRSCAITNRSPLQTNASERYTQVVVQVRLHCGTPELVAVLHSLESGASRLLIDNLNLLAQRGHGASGPGQFTGEGGLNVSFDLHGYLRPTGEAADES